MCTDYAILTPSLLLAMNYSPKSTCSGHAAAAYKIVG
ncbi:transglutaminase-like domain-containing protein [Thermococcus sp.]